MSYPKHTKNKSYSKINLIIRSSIFAIYSLITIFIYSFLMLVSFLLPLKGRHFLLRFYLRSYLSVLKLICHIDYRVEGLSHIAKIRNGIVLCKHQSVWETFYLPTIFHNPAIILKRELFWIPFFGWGLKASDPIAINRKDTSSAMQQVIEKGTKRLHEGRWILVFPEGTRVPTGHVGRYRLGGARLAAATGYPVIPVAHNAGRLWPRRSFIKYPGTVHIVIGPAIESQGKHAEEILALAKDWIETTMSRIDRLI